MYIIAENKITYTSEFNIKVCERPTSLSKSTLQRRCKYHVTNFMYVLQSKGCSFEESSINRVALESKFSVDKFVHVLEQREKEQCEHFRLNVLNKN